MQVTFHKAGELLSRRELYNIVENLEVTLHTQEQLDVNGWKFGHDYLYEIQNSEYAYQEINGNYYISINSKMFFVVKPETNRFLLISLQEICDNEPDIVDKRRICIEKNKKEILNNEIIR